MMPGGIIPTVDQAVITTARLAGRGRMAGMDRMGVDMVGLEATVETVGVVAGAG